MAEGEDSGEKIHDPTPKRLSDARERGEVPQSQDMITAATYGGFLLASLAAGPAAMKEVAQIGVSVLDQSDRLSAEMTDNGAAPLAGLIADSCWAIAPFLLLPAAAAVIAVLAQNALTFAPQKLEPKLSRLNPLATLGQKFGREGLFEFAKSTVKLTIVSVALGLFLTSRLPEIIHAADLSPALSTKRLMELSVSFLCLVLLIAAVIGGIDLLWQRAQFVHRNRMSHQDLIDEFKQSEGDPHMKAQRRQRGEEIASNRMLLDVPRSDVIVVNPQHYAIALRWDRTAGTAPVCVAKGVDALAAQIREKAAEAGIPIHRDPPTARALFATVDIGQEIRPEHYRAVAAAIRFAEAMRKKAKARR
jgi:flagellar biosynthesis protein FlhB